MASNLKNLSDFQGQDVPDGSSYKFAVVTAQWNAQVTGSLLSGAYELLSGAGVKEDNIVRVDVPGTFELTAAANQLLEKDESLNAVICLGCVIQGETRHFDFICHAVANGLSNVAIKHNKPVIFGVLTTDNLQQALDRAGGKHGNKGTEAAFTALSMVDTFRKHWYKL